MRTGPVRRRLQAERTGPSACGSRLDHESGFDGPSLDPHVPLAISEPRTVHFQTDGRGYRNRRDYRPGDIVLLGDSLVVGKGTDQIDTLRDVLERVFGISTYSLAHASSPHQSLKRLVAFSHDVGTRPPVALFIFEGNDFDTPYRMPQESNAWDQRRLRFVADHLPWLRYPPLIFGLSRRAERVLSTSENEIVVTYQIVGKPAGFYRQHIDAARDQRPVLLLRKEEFPKDEWEHLAQASCVFFIPTKYQVYAPFIEAGGRSQLVDPAPALVAVKELLQEFGGRFVDLTGPLRAAAERHLKRKELVFWRDDTHWNKHGIRAAAEEVAKCLSQAASDRSAVIR